MNYQLIAEQQAEIIESYKNAIEIINGCVMGISIAQDLKKAQEYGYLIREALTVAGLQIELVENEMKGGNSEPYERDVTTDNNQD